MIRQARWSSVCVTIVVWATVGAVRGEAAGGLGVVAQTGSYEAVQELFNARCVECHSCSNAPCQLKLTSYAGLQRGASRIKAIQPTRLRSIDPTRLGIDAHSAAEWHQDKGFFPVDDEQGGPLLAMLNRDGLGATDAAVADSHICPVTTLEANALAWAFPGKLMPYGLSPLTAPERDVLVNWVKQGRKPPIAKATDELPPELAKARADWQTFLNAPDLEHRLLARYLFEHLFHASVHFSKNSQEFYRIVRSRNTCDQPASEIATRRPSDDPQAAFHYCFAPFAETVVEKTHLPYTLDQAKLARVRDIFFATPWKVAKWPDYKATEANNPFIIYQDIPVRARYRYLLDDAQYHFATFIKGPVCYGSGAVSAIDEHFFVFFMNPASELMVRDPDFARQSESLLVLPFAEDSETATGEVTSVAEMMKTLTERTPFTNKYIEARNDYVKLKYARVRAAFPRGYQMSDIWDGDGANANAVLTVFRHFDSSYVLTGLRGGEATSYFVVDYGLFERLVYNLVVGYDVFGSLSHQIHTRVYMGMIRREAEDNFLLFLPPEARSRLRATWYQGELAKLGGKLFFDPDDNVLPARIAYKDSSRTDKELVAAMANHYFRPEVRGAFDGTPQAEYLPLGSIAETPAALAPFVTMFPDTSLILLEKGGQLTRTITVIRDRAHNSLGMMVGESLARVPQQDKLAVVDGLATSYPNLFFVVDEDQLSHFRTDLAAIRDRPAAQAFLKKWSVARTSAQFWATSDALHAYLRRTDPVAFGVLDYTRYGIWSEDEDWH